MSQQFPGSALLEQDSEGVSYSPYRGFGTCSLKTMQHTTLAAPSLCVAKSIRNYFQTGGLPTSGTLCLADLKPLVGNLGEVTSISQDRTSADQRLLEVLIAETERGYFPAI